MKRQHRIAGILSAMLIAGSFFPQALRAQQNSSQPAQPPETAQQPQQNQPAATQPNAAPSGTAPASNQSAAPADQQQQTQQPQQTTSGQSGTTINPSQAPLQPVTSYPDASGKQQEPNTQATPAQTTTVPEAPQPKKPAEPVGAAAAESVPTAGGAAAKPAGVAIAPAKQHQTRSLLIKIGAVAAAGAALGVVFALSHSTPSMPPGTATPGATPR